MAGRTGRRTCNKSGCPPYGRHPQVSYMVQCLLSALSVLAALLAFTFGALSALSVFAALVAFAFGALSALSVLAALVAFTFGTLSASDIVGAFAALSPLQHLWPFSHFSVFSQVFCVGCVAGACAMAPKADTAAAMTSVRNFFIIGCNICLGMSNRFLCRYGNSLPDIVCAKIRIAIDSFPIR